MLKKLLLLTITGLSGGVAHAQMTTISTPRGNVHVPGPNLPMRYPAGGYGPTEWRAKGTCVFRDSSQASGRVSIQPKGGEVLLRVKTKAGEQEYEPGQLAYILSDQIRYIPMGAFGQDSNMRLAEAAAWGKLEAVRSGGESGKALLLIRPRGTTQWTEVPGPNTPFSNFKKVREVLEPLVADAPAYAAALADGRITYDNLEQFLQSYNKFVAKQP